MTYYFREIRYLSRKDPIMKRVIKRIGPCTFAPDKERTLFHALVRSVAHQQLHGRAAERILGRFIELFRLPKGNKFPEPKAVLKVSPKKLRGVGFSNAKVKAIRDITSHAVRGGIPSKKDAHKMSDNEIIEKLLPLRGVGRWTAEMILIFTLGRPDVLPVDDFGIREGYRIAYKKRSQSKPKILSAYGKRWAPYRTIASWYLWRTADANKKIKK